MKSFKSYVENRDLNEMARVSSSTFPEKVADPRIQQENEKALEKCIQIVQHALDDNSQAYNYLWQLKFPNDNAKDGMANNALLIQLNNIHRAMVNHLGTLHINNDTEIFKNLYNTLSALNRGDFYHSFIEEGDLSDETIRARHYNNNYRFLVKSIIKDLESMESMLLQYKSQGDVYPKNIKPYGK